MAEHPDLRLRMGEAALNIARTAGYRNAGTVEFLVDRDRNFYFLEMNTRLQVEHPVTELVTGLDLVQWQLRIAAGEALTVRQEDVTWTGSAVECRIYAEDPDHEFMPSPGRITRLREPAGPGVRLDSGVYEGWNVPLDYDPLLAKLAVWAPSRTAAIARMRRALLEYEIGGIRTNREWFGEIMRDEAFCAGTLSTAFLDEFFMRRGEAAPDLAAECVAALVAALHQQEKPPAPIETPSRWFAAGLDALHR
jgi:acetyl-CoA carboxylase biotin carboxylase subunit